jgi:tetratricopeptide (TPR) repeat protein
MILAGIAMGSLTRWMELHVVGAVGPEFPQNFLQRLTLAGTVPWFYLQRLFLPFNLAFIYPRWSIHPIQLIGLAGLLALAFLLWLSRKTLGRGPLAAFLFFLATLFPALGFANFFPMRYSYVADHFQYLACIGPILILSAAICRFRKPAVVAPPSAALVLICCALTNARCEVFHDSLTLWQDTLAKNPNSWMVHENLGKAFQEAGDLDKAEEQYRIALNLNPNEGSIYINLGICAARRGQNPTAIFYFNQALAHMPDSTEPVLHKLRSEPYYRMGWVYNIMADADQAKPQPDPEDAEKYRNLAIDSYTQAILINPQYELALVNLGVIYSQDGKYDQAIQQFRRAISLNPDSTKAHDNLGNALLAQGQLNQALQEYQQVLRIDPYNAHAFNNIGAVYARQKHWPEAIAQFQAALSIDPSFDLARQNLDAALREEKN